ncbi:thioredoxin family protein [Flavobacterium lindanitolerans]|uniref:thioredoxin family protein n=1 Tax=Flavobacterium lindanitolerans TaxID=428988 RepID=UPI00280875AF|nr:thioredoxin family protein [Flavobacterium lindanitolerans]MDQ7959399.1 thioredoxin family protein [Flavobacterium lindanitolerans]
MKKWFLILALVTAVPTFAQLKTHTFEEAEKLAAATSKPYVIFIHTDWCKFCKMMENTTLKNKELITALNQNFYFISFDAEDKKDIFFNGTVFKFKPKGNNSGVHELATALAEKNGNTAYPSIVILNSDYSIAAQLQSYINAKDLLQMLHKIR